MSGVGPAGAATAARRPGPGRRLAHGAVVAAVVFLSAGGVGAVAILLSLCGMAGGRCTGDELAAMDRAQGSALLVLLVGVPVVALAVRRARWQVTAACSLGVVGLAAGLAALAVAGAR